MGESLVWQARKLLKQLLSIGVVAGAVVGGLAISIPWFCPRVFTSDAAIIEKVRPPSCMNFIQRDASCFFLYLLTRLVVYGVIGQPAAYSVDYLCNEN